MPSLSSGTAWAPKYPGQEYVEALPLTNTPEERRLARRNVAGRASVERWSAIELSQIFEALNLQLGEQDRE